MEQDEVRNISTAQAEESTAEAAEQERERGAGIAATFSPSRAFLYSAFQKTDRVGSNRIRDIIFYVVIVLFAMDNLCSIVVTENKITHIVLFILCALMIVEMMYVSRTGNDHITQTLYAGGVTYTITFYEGGFAIDFPEERREIGYGEKVKIYNFPEFYSIRYRDNRAFAVPKKAFEPEKLETLDRLLEKKLAGRFKRHS